jgi:protein-disulfide isomerase
MKQLLFTGLLAVVALVAQAASSAPQAAPDPQLVDAIMRKLDASGAIDRVADKALEHVIERRQQESRAAETQRQAQAQKRAQAARKVSAGRDHIRGDPAAEVSLIEYSDFECPFCKRFHGTPGKLTQRYAGRVNWVYRHFPLPFHEPAARREAIASECAAEAGGNEAFWSYAEALFRETRSNGEGLAKGRSIEALATDSGLDAKRFSSCLASGSAARRVDEDLADGAAVGISGTPTTVVRNNRTGACIPVVGAQPAEALASVIEQVLGPKR